MWKEKLAPLFPSSSEDVLVKWQKWLWIGGGIALLSLFLWLIYLSQMRRVYQFDGMLYVHAGYALSLGVGAEASDLATRSPMLPFLLSLFFSLFSFSPPSSSLPYLSLCFLGVFALFLYFSFRLLLRFFPPIYAFLGSLFLAFHRIFLHYSFEPMTDILAALLTVIAVLLYLEYREQKKLWSLLLCSLYLGLLFATRQMLAVAAVALFFAHFYELLKRNWRRTWKKNVLELACLSLFPMWLGFALYGLIPYLQGRGFSFWFFFTQIRYYGEVPLHHPTDFFVEPVLYILLGGGVGYFLLFLYGLYIGRKKSVPPLFYSFFLVAFVLVPFVWKHHEGRYYLFVQPFAVFFALLVLHQIAAKNKKLQIGALALWLVTACFPLVQEVYTLQEPFLKQPFYEEVAKVVRDFEKDMPTPRFYFLHVFYALYPESFPQWYHMMRCDEFYHFYHVFWYPISLSSGLWGGLGDSPFFPEPQVWKQIFQTNPPPKYPPWQLFLRHPLRHFPHGSIILYGTPWVEYGASLGDFSAPLLVTQVRTELLSKKGDFWSKPPFRLVWDQSQARLESPHYPLELYFRKQGRRKVWLGTVLSATEIVLVNNRKVPLEDILASLGLGPKDVFLIAYPKIVPIYRFPLQGKGPSSPQDE